jgi:L-lactate dehydrogenase
VKIGVIGAGHVGAAVVSSLLHQGGLGARIAVVDHDEKRAEGLAGDMGIAAELGSPSSVAHAAYDSLGDASLVIVTAGVNEKDGGATDRSDPRGRRVLIPANARAFAEIIPAITEVAPTVPILVVTDPPDPLADLARALAKHERVVSTGTVIDTARFRHQIARTLGVSPLDVQAYVVGEHGTSSVYLWSCATVGGVSVLDQLREQHGDPAPVTQRIEDAVAFGNISIIEGIGASQYGIGEVVARIATTMVLGGNAVLPVASYQPDLGVTVALPSVLGSNGVVRSFRPAMTEAEQHAFDASVDVLRDAQRLALECAGL